MAPFEALLLLLPAAFFQPCVASAFLRLGAIQPEVEEPQTSLLDELQALGSEHLVEEGRLVQLEASLRPTFAALPKSRRGVSSSAARYALHRLFVQRHGWHMKGLAPGGDEVSPAAALGSRLPGVRDVFEARFAAGLDLRELATLAAHLENVVQAESNARLHMAYQALQFPLASRLPAEQVTAVLELCMASYILGVEATALTVASAATHVKNVEEQYPNWDDTRAFLKQVKADVAPAPDAALSFEELSTVLSAVEDRFGRWQTQECTALKETLVGLEDSAGSGRVLLSDFYGSSVNADKWQFSESIDYLRQLGALDETEPNLPRVIIPNYIAGPSNCVASTDHYGVCCIEECGLLMDSLEQKFQAPSTTVPELLAAVSALPSASRAANRTLPASLQRLLEDVAEYHGGRVPLHGRLFAQWMHLAYPRECPYPHLSGTTNPLRTDQFKAATGLAATESSSERWRIAEAGAPPDRTLQDGSELCTRVWTMEEELVDPTAHRAANAPQTKQEPRKSPLRDSLRILAQIAAIGSVCVVLGRKVSELADDLRSGRLQGPKLYFV